MVLVPNSRDRARDITSFKFIYQVRELLYIYTAAAGARRLMPFARALKLFPHLDDLRIHFPFFRFSLSPLSISPDISSE